MFGILNGQASVTFIDNRAHGNTVAVLSPGEVVGEMAMLTGDRRSATVSALTNVEAVEIARPALEKLFAQSPELMDAFAANLARRKAQLDRFAVEPTKASAILAQIRNLFGAAAALKPQRKT
jgi:CRP-like cAMP-binding protein